jgi:hypothetical protein
MAKCCICDAHIEREDAPVLSMGGAGYARVLCDRCSGLLDTATLGQDFEEIKGAIAEIGDLMADHDPDNVTFNIVSGLMLEASERAKAIRDGSYDFALDSVENNEGFDEIPEELRESEEDIQKDKEDEEKLEKFNKFYNYVLIGAGIGAAAIIIWKIIDTFLL